MSLKAIYSPTAASTKKCLANLAKLNIPNDSLPTPYHDQGEHDQCSPYDDKGTSSPSSPSLPPLSFFTNLTIIIVTVPIHVLPVLLEHIAELELDPPPHIITEKPALPTTPNATLLAALQSYTGNIAVLENWLTRPCYHRFKTRLTTTSLPTPPCSYTFEITQTLDTTSWRADGASSYRGGGCRDVGVHAIRLVRDLFGPVASVSDHLSSFSSSTHSLSGTLVHQRPSIAGTVSFKMVPPSPPSPPTACLTVHFPNSPDLTYDIASSPHFLAGGVSAALNDALQFVLGERHNNNDSGKMTFEEGVRDCAVIDALCLAAPAPAPFLLLQQRATNSVYANTTETNERTFPRVARCAGTDDVVAAAKAAAALDLTLCPIGGENAMAHASSVNDNVLRLEMSMMDRILSYDEQASTITVQPNVTLRKLVEVLGSMNKVLPSLPILLDQSVAGCVSTGSHGSSLKHGCVSDQITDSTSIDNVLVELTLRVEDRLTLTRREHRLDMEDPSVNQQLRDLANSEHAWVQWRVGVGAVCVCLERDADGQIYNGRNWFPYSKELDDLVEGERGGKKFTLQHSFALDRIGEVVQFVKQEVETGRVVELKFLGKGGGGGSKPNSGFDYGAVCLNVWWDCEGDEDMVKLERSLSRLNGNVHYGKWHSGQSGGGDVGVTLSVIMPVFNALPYLGLALRDCLRGFVGEGLLEIVVSDDGSSDGSFEFLQDVVKGLGCRGRRVVEGGGGVGGNPSLIMKKREAADIAFVDRPPEIQEIFDHPLGSEEVVREAHRNVRLVVVEQRERKNVGQGKCMGRCLKYCSGKYLGFMESDDERDSRQWAEMVRRMEMGGVDAVVGETTCVGWKREGMERYVKWQNSTGERDLAGGKCRYIEIPALMQSTVVRRDSMCLEEGFRDDKKWCIDLYFWMRFWETGGVVARLGAEKGVFYWRQHPGQQTRNHGRLSIENLRRCKCEFVKRALGEGAAVEVWGVGITLEGWVEDLNEEMGAAVEVRGVDWKGGRAKGERAWREESGKVMRLFCFGMDAARIKVRDELKELWDDETCWFVA